MGSLWPWGKCRVAVVTVSLALLSTGAIGDINSGVSYAGESALPPGVAADDIEYNGRITVGGETVTAAINTAKKKGVIVFDGTAGERINIGFHGVSLTQFRVALYGPDGAVVPTQASAVRNYYATMQRELSSQTKVQTSTTAYKFTDDETGSLISSSQMNGASIDFVELPATGTYTILLDPLSVYTGSVTIAVSNALSGEIVPQGSAVAVDIKRVGQNAYYTFSGQSGQTVSVQLSDVTIRSGYFSILKPDGMPLGKPTSFVSGGAMIPGQVLPTSGTYAILIDPDLSYTGRAKLALYNAPELTGSIMIDQVTATPTLTVPGQRARYTFDGTAGQRVNLGITGVSILSSTVSILRPDGTKWEATTIGPSGGSLDPLTALPETGTYTIMVEPVSNYTGSMTLALSSPVTGTLALDGPSVPVSLTKPGQTARYTFSGKAGQWVSLGLTSVDITSSAVTLMTSEGTILASTAVGTAGGALEDQNPLPATGTYTVLIDPVGSYTGKMTATLSTEVSDSLKINAAPRAIMISRAGQNGRYTFMGTANQQVAIKVTQNTIGNVNVSLYSPNGILQTGVTSSASSFTLKPVTLATSEMYTITINPPMPDTGSIHVQVTSP
ncbi:MAG: hypothetical protein CV089_12220 [Nitrospira sp. WS110]|nr:hypothetical protein [Nitrospira sp. WS110]